MSKTTKYLTIVSTVATLLIPVAAMAVSVVLPTVPAGTGGGEVTGSSLVSIIQQVVQYVMIVSVTIGVAAFVIGAIRYAIGQTDEGKKWMLNAAIGVAAMLAVGLIINSIAGLVRNVGGGSIG